MNREITPEEAKVIEAAERPRWTRKPTLRERFYDRLASKSGSGCWLWGGSKMTGDDYGRVRWQGRQLSAHRVSWEIHYGPIPDGLCVMHVCDNQRCVNPAHLRLGTVADNNADMTAKGRSTRGTRHPNAKLSEADVRAIRGLAGTASQETLGRRFGVTQSAISDILVGRRWGHLLNESEARKERGA